MGKWLSAALPAFLVLAGCSEAPALSEDLPPGPEPTPVETLAFNQTVKIMQAGFGLAGASTPIDESCLAVQVTRGWVPFRVEARQTWEAQSSGAQELWLALFEDRTGDQTAAEKGPSPVSLSHEWRIGPHARSRAAEGDRVLQFFPSMSTAGAVVQQEVHVEVAVAFAKHPEGDERPYIVPCYELV